jgi:hypothetical protein
MKPVCILLSLLLCRVQGFSASVGRKPVAKTAFALSPVGYASRSIHSHNPNIVRSNLGRITSLNLQKVPDTSDDGKLTVKQKVEVCLYRIALISASMAYTSGQLSQQLLTAGSGVPAESVAAIEQNAHAILGWGILLAALLAPPNLGSITDQKEENDVDNALFLLLNELLPILASFAIVVEIVNTIQSNLSQGTADFLSGTSDTLDNTTNLFICAICLREIGFFGASYKAEAILAILFCSILSLNDAIGFSDVALNSAIALCLLVLSFGKVFEPIEDDLRPNESNFFKDSR